MTISSIVIAALRTSKNSLKTFKYVMFTEAPVENQFSGSEIDLDPNFIITNLSIIAAIALDYSRQKKIDF